MTNGKETVQLYFITGFLGSGKTTFLKEILNLLPREKVGLIVNEFGQINVDGEIITTESGFEVVEINNGQVFCGCVRGSFVEAIADYVKLPIRHLIVETSGMANPYNIEDVLANVARIVPDGYQYKGMICIVDPTKVLALAESLNAVREQIAKSEFLLINKADLVSHAELHKVEHLVRKLNPNAPLLVTSYGKIEEEMFLSFLAGDVSHLNAQVDRVDQTERRPLNYLIEGTDSLSFEGLAAFCEEASVLSYRLKGYAQTDRGPILVTGLDTAMEYTDARHEVSGFHLVLISSQGDVASQLSSLADEHLAGVEVTITEKGKEYWD